MNGEAVWFHAALFSGGLNLKTAVDFNAEAQRCRVTQRKCEVM